MLGRKKALPHSKLVSVNRRRELAVIEARVGCC
jgi:hypothetical protein